MLHIFSVWAGRHCDMLILCLIHARIQYHRLLIFGSVCNLFPRFVEMLRLCTWLEHSAALTETKTLIISRAGLGCSFVYPALRRLVHERIGAFMTLMTHVVKTRLRIMCTWQYVTQPNTGPLVRVCMCLNNQSYRCLSHLNILKCTCVSCMSSCLNRLSYDFIIGF